MNLEELINLLDDIILGGWSLPLTNGKCIADREKIKDIIQDIRLNMPSEINQAKAIVADKNNIIERAKKEAEDIVNRAKKEAERLTSEHEIVKAANEKANEAIVAAHARAREIKKNTNVYSEGILENMEDLLTKTLLDVKQTRQQIKQITK